MRTWVAIVFAAVGCSSSTTTLSVDAAQQVDAIGNACTGAAYDPCTTNAQCTSMNCKFYMMSNFSVCTQACTPGNNSTCPIDKGGANGVCNNMGLCKPAMPNSCTR